MKAPLLFVIVAMIHIMGISGFVLMQGCATRQPLDQRTGQPTAVTPPSSTAPQRTVATRSPATMRPGAPVMPPRPGFESLRYVGEQ